MTDILDLVRVREEPLSAAETESLFDRIFEGRLSDEQLLAYLPSTRDFEWKLAPTNTGTLLAAEQMKIAALLSKL